jgi:hypothetical protein
MPDEVGTRLLVDSRLLETTPRGVDHRTLITKLLQEPCLPHSVRIDCTPSLKWVKVQHQDGPPTNLVRTPQQARLPRLAGRLLSPVLALEVLVTTRTDPLPRPRTLLDPVRRHLDPVPSMAPIPAKLKKLRPPCRYSSHSRRLCYTRNSVT